MSKENSARQSKIDEMAKGYQEELDKLKDAFEKKQEKLDKILKKLMEKQVDLDAMLRDQDKYEKYVAFYLKYLFEIFHEIKQFEIFFLFAEESKKNLKPKRDSTKRSRECAKSWTRLENRTRRPF